MLFSKIGIKLYLKLTISVLKGNTAVEEILLDGQAVTYTEIDQLNYGLEFNAEKGKSYKILVNTNSSYNSIQLGSNTDKNKFSSITIDGEVYTNQAILVGKDTNVTVKLVTTNDWKATAATVYYGDGTQVESTFANDILTFNVATAGKDYYIEVTTVSTANTIKLSSSTQGLFSDIVKSIKVYVNG